MKSPPPSFCDLAREEEERGEEETREKRAAAQSSRLHPVILWPILLVTLDTHSRLLIAASFFSTDLDL
jgi:hypothetical protein